MSQVANVAGTSNSLQVQTVLKQGSTTYANTAASGITEDFVYKVNGKTVGRPVVALFSVDGTLKCKDDNGVSFDLVGTAGSIPPVLIYSIESGSTGTVTLFSQ